MKKQLNAFIVSGLVILATGLWLFKSARELSSTEIIKSDVILLVVTFALFLGFKKLSSVKRGEPAEDELSKKILQKTAAVTYYVCLYKWVFLIW
ncbi:MAG: hypothetical protein JW894_04875 [Bacteroidales bacterium]|nr:hypothetical protein [Bacteroidales bacterium]